MIVIMFSHVSIKGQTSSSPKSYSSSEGFVAHEWGTFTSLRSSNGTVLSGLEREEEALPAFVNNLTFSYRVETINKGFYNGICNIKNVTIKMETPVLYFYHTETSPKTCTTNVKFSNGTISQWYPGRSGGEFLPEMLVYNQTGGALPVNQVPVVDFSLPRIGSISWIANILPKSDDSKYTTTPGQETQQWITQRKTNSNLVKTQIWQYDYIKNENYSIDQIEKFLFYRGMGNFIEPLDVMFNSSGNLVISNKGKDKFTYVLVYERKRDSSIVVHWSGSISGNTVKVVEMSLGKSKDPVNEMEKFVSRLIAAGLYEDEARAMLSTWQKSYFEHEGLKVFWIVPPAFTEEVLPLTIAPQPDFLKRVLVGRSEILTPEFEKELMSLKGTQAQLFDTLCKYDRFGLAYKALLDTGIPGAWINYNTMTKDEDPPEEMGLKTNYSQSKNVELFPNPVTGYLTAKIYDDVDEAVFLKIFNTKGELVNSFSGIKKGENLISLESLPTGMYNVRIDFDDGNFISKKIVKP